MFSIKDYQIPKKPGCYLYKDSHGFVIYVGKAKLLSNRVRSYFNLNLQDPKTKLLVSKIRDVEFIITGSEVEALLLEQSLIHKYNPKFNIDLKGSIRYAYIKITNELFPRILTSRSVDQSGKFFGPYTDGSIRRQVINTLISLFKIRTCVKLPKKVCLQYHIGNCLGPCEEFVSRDIYQKNINNAIRLLKGETKDLIEELKGSMIKASKERMYELAKMYRDQVNSLENIASRQRIDQAKSHDQDVIQWIQKDKKIYFQVFNIISGVVASRHSFSFDFYQGVVEDFINHFYSVHFIPSEIVLPENIKNEPLILKYLQETKRQKFSFNYLSKVEISVPKKGIKKELLDLVSENLMVSSGSVPGVIALQKKLRLSRAPSLIDFFDISNLKNTAIVGACIQLKDNQFHKSGYRKFIIKTTKTQDDFMSMEESVYRRYSAILEEGGILPDLIVIDGGRGQLSAGIKALARLELAIPIISLAKREEEIYVPGTPSPFKLDKYDQGIQMLIKGRNEVHRFVLSFNRKRRKKELFGN